MKYTRLEFNLRKNAYRRLFTAKFLVLIPVAGLFFGYIISRFIIVPYFTGSAKTDTVVYADQNVNEGQFKKEIPKYESIKARKYLTAQVGVFASETNAQLFAERIKSVGLPAYIHREDGYSRVVVGISTDRASMNGRAAKLKEAGYTCLIKELNISPNEVAEPLKSRDEYRIASNVANIIGDSLDSICSILDKNIDDSVHKDSISESIKGVCEKLIKDMEIIENMNVDADMNLSGILNSCMEIKAIISDTSDSILKFEENTIKSIFIYKNLMEQYNNREE